MALCSIGPRQITGASSCVRKPIDTTWMPYFSAGLICLPSVCELRLQAEHDRHVRSVDVAVEHADAGAALRQRHREVHRHRRLADAALAGADRDHVLDAGQRRLAVLGRRHRLHDERGRDRRRRSRRAARRPLRARARRAPPASTATASPSRSATATRPPSMEMSLSLTNLSVTTSTPRSGSVTRLQRIQDRLRGHKKFSLPRA